jgi:dihydroflavonol-4-reductase
MPAAPVLITGISGFIAKHCAVELLNAGYRVRGTVRKAAARDAVRATLAKHADVGALEFVEADLLSDDRWAKALEGCGAVLHVASPFPDSQPKDENVLIRPAVEGTLRVLRAASAAGVPRFVQTSSMVAVMYGHARTRTAPYTEADWTILQSAGVTAYARSKTLAERAAREFIAAHRDSPRYASVNPGLVLGPALDRDIGTSADLIRRFLKGKYPGAPRLSMPVVDARDVARMHRLALEADQPSGARYLAVSESIWFIDLARALRDELGGIARSVPTRLLPDWAVKLVALFDPMARQAVPDLGLWYGVDNSQTRRALGIEFISAAKAAAATGESLVRLGLV